MTTNEIQPDQTIDAFLDKLIREKGILKLEQDPDVLRHIKDDLKKRLEMQVNAVIIKSLPESKLDEFEDLLDKGNQEELSRFCELNIKDLKELIAGEFLRFRTIYLALS